MIEQFSAAEKKLLAATRNFLEAKNAEEISSECRSDCDELCTQEIPEDLQSTQSNQLENKFEDLFCRLDLIRNRRRKSPPHQSL